MYRKRERKARVWERERGRKREREREARQLFETLIKPYLKLYQSDLML